VRLDELTDAGRVIGQAQLRKQLCETVKDFVHTNSFALPKTERPI
jgi:hypothetical protein